MASTLSRIDKYTKKQTVNNNQEKLLKQIDTSDIRYVRCWLYKHHVYHIQRNKEIGNLRDASRN